METWLHWVDLAGVAVFAIAGTLMAYKKHMDGFGVVVLASVIGIGGGTLRDMILDLPVFWVQDPSFFYVIILAAFSTIICYVARTRSHCVICFLPMLLV